ncbi:hypothetical protein AB835_11110 [Candidatus Endobugula sertula]|uniref:Uncharacterized protein n=1 Tax=Candidatus Endobugula sertula TaxID=62101 RepID=A0A1D2QNA1_9GAMM|nr:hypothetical protein AB835_11110 [Candidatus Endobugula sertula]
MTNSNDKSGSPLHPTKISLEAFKTELETQFSALREAHDDNTHRFRFFLHAIEALIRPLHDQIESDDWHLGLWLTGRWINELLEQELQQVIHIENWLDAVVITTN